MMLAKEGDKVKIDFTGKLGDGTVFDSTLESECSPDECETDGCETDDCGCGCEAGPMELTIGGGEFFPQIEEALVGMEVGGKKSVLVPAADAFGEYDEERVFTVPRQDLPQDMNPTVGDQLVLTGEDDEELGVTVVEVNDESVTFDANHPLAGEDLTFDFELVEIL
jgi:peptidylprolyl isomerase